MCNYVPLYSWGTHGRFKVSEKPPPKKKSALVQLICFLSSSGGFQGGKVLSLRRSEVRALRLWRQTGEFQVIIYPQNTFFNLRPLSRASGSPSALHQLLFTSCQSCHLHCAPVRFPNGCCHSLICMHQQTHTRASAAASPVRSVSSVFSALLFHWRALSVS